jgi:secondary thiamine-phosphate synthase enzyme
MKSIKIKTNKRIEAINITKEVETIVKNENIKEGIIFLFNPHTTAALLINEGFDESVLVDLNNKLNNLIPEDDSYLHLEGNSDAHIKSSLIGNQLFVFIKNNKLELGKWQKVFFLEFDGPRTREIWVKILKEK